MYADLDSIGGAFNAHAVTAYKDDVRVTVGIKFRETRRTRPGLAETKAQICKTEIKAGCSMSS